MEGPKRLQKAAKAAEADFEKVQASIRTSFPSWSRGSQRLAIA